MRKSPTIQSVDKALNILELFTDYEQLGITDIRNKLAYGKSVIYKIIITLESHGFVKQNPDNKKYRLGPKAFQIVNQYLAFNGNINPLLRNAYPLLRELAQETMCTAQLGIIEKNEMEVLIVASVESPSLVRVSASLGEKMPIHASAVGKCMLAYGDDYLLKKVLSKPLKAVTPTTIINKKRFLEEINKVKSLGYALSDEEWGEGVIAIACPVFNYLKSCIASLLISFPAYKKEEEQFEMEGLINSTKKYAYKLSQQIGYAG